MGQLGGLPIHTATQARNRIFSYGLSAIDMTSTFCGGHCIDDGGTATMYITVQCTAAPIRFRVIGVPTPFEIVYGIPLHGEVCPGQWIYHHAALIDSAFVRSAKGVRFH